MPEKTPYHENQLRDYSSLFSRGMVQDWLKGVLTSIAFKIERYDSNRFKSGKQTYLDYLKYVYALMETHYRTEYILKNEFLNHQLIKEVKTTDAQVFSEFRVGNAIADLALFNGHSTAFEIKTELDSDRRLFGQIENYKKVFNRIFLIVPASKLSLYEKTDRSTGLIVFHFDKDRNKHFEVHRKADVCWDIEPETMMASLHTNEYKAIVNKHFGVVMGLTAFNQYERCLGLIRQIPVQTFNTLFIEQIKERNQRVTLTTRYFKEFNQLSLALKMSKNEHKRLIQVLKTPIKA
ncbi:MAG: sce7726 family protein [Bacteroidetes bacterium]|nr:sce7726 family protein [Bacteroidota bacterium]MBU1579508.1 sce7726 family protein [Bacteroidota bacterium]MBU2466460.1 sce7726 family protein [Bacteroidota bacterium]MBU2558845.1 sce7726 family protein [Bacteroidota bacterium]